MEQQGAADKGETVQSPTDPASRGVSRRAAHPFARLLTKGVADLLDETDVVSHLPAPQAARLLDASEKFRSIDPLKDRMDAHVGSFVLTFDASIKDLLEFGCVRSSLQITAPESACIRRPFLDHAGCISEQTPPNWLERVKNKHAILPAAVNAKLVQNEFEGLLRDPIKFGSSLNESFLEVVSHVDRGNIMAQNYRASIATKMLTFSMDSTMTDTVQIVPMMPASELERSCTTAFLTREVVERGVLKHSLAENKMHCYFPEEHGLAHVVKIAGPSVVSNLRVYALKLPRDKQNQDASANPKVFVRIPEKTYEETLDFLFREEINPKLDRSVEPKDICFWLGYKCTNEGWTDADEKRRLSDLCNDEYTKKRKVSFKITASFLALGNAPERDLFWSSPVVIGSYLPGIPFVDGCTPRSEQSKKNAPSQADRLQPGSADPLPSTNTSRAYKDILARALPHYLKEHRQERQKFKEGGSKNQDYLEALLDV
jgi:hypothetical protein